MTSPADIRWSSYTQYEGPFFKGTVSYALPYEPTDNDKLLAVITATEGGHYDAMNMYDSCILTAGVIQWCERGQYSVSDMLGAISNANPALLAPLQPALDQAKAKFTKNEKGRWRFFFDDARGEVDTTAEQRALFLLNSNGDKGTWDDESKAYAKLWAASVANVLAQPEALRPQIDFTVPRLQWFALPDARKILWDPSDPKENSGMVGALRAAFISYAANNPTIAKNMLVKATAGSTAEKWSLDWAVPILREMTFGPNIMIYPRRYNSIRPVLEKLYGVDLPDFADDLKAWEAQHDIEPGPGAPTFTDPKEIQSELIAEGYDLGPYGADGVIGKKTKTAIMTFQGLHGLVVDGIVGPMTRKALLAEWMKRQ